MMLFSIIHEHRHGVSTDVVTCDRWPTKDEVVAACNLDYEPDMDETIEIIRIGDISKIPHIQ